MGVQKSTRQTVGKIFHVGIQCPLYPTTDFSHQTSGSKHFEQKAGQIWLVGVHGLFLNTGWLDTTLGCPQYLDEQYVRDFRCNILPRVQLQTCCWVCPLIDSHVYNPVWVWFWWTATPKKETQYLVCFLISWTLSEKLEYLFFSPRIFQCYFMNIHNKYIGKIFSALCVDVFPELFRIFPNFDISWYMTKDSEVHLKNCLLI
jgi:hypothetical protein